MFPSCQVAIFARVISSSKTTKKIQNISFHFLFIRLLLKCPFVLLWATWFSQYNCSLIHVRVSWPKMPGNAFSSIQDFKNFLGEHAPRPPRNNGLKPIVWVLQIHSCLLFTKLWLLKNSKKMLRLREIQRYWKWDSVFYFCVNHSDKCWKCCTQIREVQCDGHKDKTWVSERSSHKLCHQHHTGDRS